MNFDWGTLFGMALQTVPQPRKVARDVQGLGFSRGVLWQALLLLLVATTFLGVISSILFPISADEMGPLFSDPIMTGVAQGSITVLMVFAIYWIGRALGGTGTFDQALLTVIWLQFVLLVIELGVLFLGVFAPGLALILWVMGLVMTFWILSHFIAEMHGFRSAGMVFAGLLAVILLVVIVMSLVFALIGLGLPTADLGAA